MDAEAKRKNAGKNRVDDFLDLILVNILFVVSCLPVVTGGAALSALYSAVSHMDEKRKHGGILTMYWEALKANWKKATVLWCIVLAGMILICVDLAIVSQMSSIWKYCYYGLLAFVAILLQTVVTVGLPVLVEGGGSFRQILRRTFFVLGMEPVRVLAACVLQILPVLAALLAGKIFAALFLIWVTVYFSVVEWGIAALLKKPIRTAVISE